MTAEPLEFLTTPRVNDLGLVRLTNATGLSVSVLPNGALFALAHVRGDRRILINQVLGSPVGGAMARLFIRRGGSDPATVSVVGSVTGMRVGYADDRIVWEKDEGDLRCQATLWLHPDLDVWLWRVCAVNRGDAEISCDAVFVQDLGLGDQGFLMGNEAYASQYLDHFVAHHPSAGCILMTRQNLSQAASIPGPRAAASKARRRSPRTSGKLWVQSIETETVQLGVGA